jgi:hypothetical protein
MTEPNQHCWRAAPAYHRRTSTPTTSAHTGSSIIPHPNDEDPNPWYSSSYYQNDSDENDRYEDESDSYGSDEDEANTSHSNGGISANLLTSLNRFAGYRPQNPIATSSSQAQGHHSPTPTSIESRTIAALSGIIGGGSGMAPVQPATEATAAPEGDRSLYFPNGQSSIIRDSETLTFDVPKDFFHQIPDEEPKGYTPGIHSVDSTNQYTQNLQATVLSGQVRTPPMVAEDPILITCHCFCDRIMALQHLNVTPIIVPYQLGNCELTQNQEPAEIRPTDKSILVKGLPGS